MEKKCVYPPLEKIEGGKKIQIDNSEHRALYGLYSECKAIVTKPGGGSLLDSLITRKSLVLLEPIAKHEKENMMLWQKLGFGITFEQWREMEFSSEVLEEMNDRIGKFITNTEIDELSKMVLERAYV